MELEADDPWIDQDPTTLSSITLQAHRVLESLLCPGDGHSRGCHCSALQKHYGPRLFRCGYTTCLFHRVAFEKKLARDRHIKHHGRPFKCPITDCEYSTIGFLSQGQCNRHYDHLHSAPVKEDIAAIHDTTSPDEMEHIIYDLVARDEVNEMKGLATHLERLESPKRQNVRELAAYSGSLEMARVLIDYEYRNNTINNPDSLDEEYMGLIMVKSVEGKNEPVFSWLCENFQIKGYSYKGSNSVSAAVMDSGSTELFDIWRDNLTRFDNLENSLKCDAIPTKQDLNLETRLAKLWTENNALGKFDKMGLNIALRHVTKYSCSVKLVTTLIQCGADPNFNGSAHGLTPLILASKKRTEEAANIMKTLLLAGADPYHEKKFRNKDTTETAAMGAGARGISRWLGITWDELVAWTQEERKNNAAV